ncbi:hypothetical protein BDM02DRAFT_1514438 [Thelephora ganbajun]|uniref:Uncharacterized protein n=1 Tax=Thelephora ganbajun TaxID=370292 RepID=A0ACB6ZLV9_THEGA|nr:hypothetical protein BDM02DRAFT_1514438 [Thelephora ganbajun]
MREYKASGPKNSRVKGQLTGHVPLTEDSVFTRGVEYDLFPSNIESPEAEANKSGLGFRKHRERTHEDVDNIPGVPPHQRKKNRQLRAATEIRVCVLNLDQIEFLFWCRTTQMNRLFSVSRFRKHERT